MIAKAGIASPSRDGSHLISRKLTEHELNLAHVD
jgi:hypothetical protein